VGFLRCAALRGFSRKCNFRNQKAGIYPYNRDAISYVSSANNGSEESGEDCQKKMSTMRKAEKSMMMTHIVCKFCEHLGKFPDTFLMPSLQIPSGIVNNKINNLYEV